eukprot:gb/GECG01006884.1/.p1 GENE.gb/GECG01006884.1/~~gb/GECG01006884.1/.p1  ORF type:complete len:257 (+),score=32.57 gb/GECG01006884.1/:1-771(+)
MGGDDADHACNGDAFLELLCRRHSKRGFRRDIPVPQEMIRRVLSAAGQGTPSTKNTQPWGVSVVTGDLLDSLRGVLLEKFDNHVEEESEYQNRPVDPTLPEFDDKVATYGRELFTFKGLARDDAEERRNHERRNFSFFEAPLLILLHVPDRAVAGTFVDAGLFLQSVLLGFHAHGYGCCPQYSLTRYSRTLKDFHKNKGIKPLLPDDRILVCGISIGAVDSNEPINQFVLSRDLIENWVTFHDSSRSMEVTDSSAE